MLRAVINSSPIEAEFSKRVLVERNPLVGMSRKPLISGLGRSDKRYDVKRPPEIDGRRNTLENGSQLDNQSSVGMVCRVISERVEPSRQQSERGPQTFDEELNLSSWNYPFLRPVIRRDLVQFHCRELCRPGFQTPADRCLSDARRPDDQNCPVQAAPAHSREKRAACTPRALAPTWRGMHNSFPGYSLEGLQPDGRSPGSVLSAIDQLSHRRAPSRRDTEFRGNPPI